MNGGSKPLTRWAAGGFASWKCAGRCEACRRSPEPPKSFALAKDLTRSVAELLLRIPRDPEAEVAIRVGWNLTGAHRGAEPVLFVHN